MPTNTNITPKSKANKTSYFQRFNWYLSYLFFRLLVGLVACLPESYLYRLADGIYYILYKIVRYRKKVVLKNLHKSFPTKTAAEIEDLAQRYYRHLADIIIESFWGFSLSAEDLVSRYKMKNPEILAPFFEKKQNIIAVGAHYANWEWGVLCAALQVPHQLIGIYKPLNNIYIDTYMRQKRAIFKLTLASIKSTYQTFQDNDAHLVAYAMLSDQSPSNTKEAIWVDFLNQKTACLHGVEKYAKLYNYPVFYIAIKRIKRGSYTYELSLISDQPQTEAKGVITQKYMQKLEAQIKDEPYCWLWSHNRWKHQA